MQLVVTDDFRRSRLTVFFRPLLALPHVVWLATWSVLTALLAVVAWVAGLATGRIPARLHSFFRAYIRYALHAGAYLGLFANPFPGFTGSGPYPVDLELPGPERQSRWSIGFRLLLAVPALVLASVLGAGLGVGAGLALSGVAAVCAVLGWFAALALGRMPSGLSSLGAYGLGYSAQALAYVLMVTDRYPNAHPEQLGPTWSLPDHPVRLNVDSDNRRARLLVLFRPLLILPHVVWYILWTIAWIPVFVVNAFTVLAIARSPRSLHRFLASYTRYSAHVYAFAALVGGPFPGFTGAARYPVDIEIAPPARQRRLVSLLRLVYLLPVIPAGLVLGALEAAAYLVAVFGWFAALVTGRMPGGLLHLGAAWIRYRSQVTAYISFLTDVYPHASPALRAPRPEEHAAELYGEAAA